MFVSTARQLGFCTKYVLIAGVKGNITITVTKHPKRDTPTITQSVCAASYCGIHPEHKMCFINIVLAACTDDKIYLLQQQQDIQQQHFVLFDSI